MKVLILGSGGREHALAWKISQSKQLKELYVAPGNAGTRSVAKNIPINVNDFEAIGAFCIEFEIQMVIVGPEDPLVHGIHDYFLEDSVLQYIAIIGPQKAAAALEGSKEFAKEFMIRHGIPTAKYKSFTADSLEEGYRYLEESKAPYVLKADGLAAGKGVVILDTLVGAKTELHSMLLDKKFGAASTTVVIEEFLDGIELSVFVLADGKNYKILPTAKDYKRIGEADTGLNTGGMGAISPVPFADVTFMDKIEKQIVLPTIKGLEKDKTLYKGFIFIGLIKVGDDPKVIEYNVRLGDPETEVVLPRIKNDFLDICNAIALGTLDALTLDIDARVAATIMLVSGGYPGKYQKDIGIKGFEEIVDSIAFHAGTVVKNNIVVTSGGRVMAVTSLAPTMKQALALCYKNTGKIVFEGAHFRKDIGFDL